MVRAGLATARRRREAVSRGRPLAGLLPWVDQQSL